MRQIKLALVWSVGAALSWAAAGPALAQQRPAPGTGTLTIDLRGLRSDNGRVMLALFNKEAGFPKEIQSAYRRADAAIKGGKARVTLRDLPPGAYAVTVFHDENNNRKLDTSWIGRPLEGVGASRDAMGRRGPPRFAEAKLELAASSRTIAILVRY